MHVWVCVVFIGMYYEFLRPSGAHKLCRSQKRKTKQKGNIHRQYIYTMSYFIYILYYILVQLKSKHNRVTDCLIGWWKSREYTSSLAPSLESQQAESAWIWFRCLTFTQWYIYIYRRTHVRDCMLYNLCYIGIYIYFLGISNIARSKQFVSHLKLHLSMEKHFGNTISGFSFFFSFFWAFILCFLSWVFL